MGDQKHSTLAGSRSPFLRHGAEQPVSWLPWCDEAFARARRENRPILLDIGAVWCHWCHVMDHESYADPETAALINDHFVPVKVDRDERPDVDARYQRAVQMVSGQGGWPLTAFLTPDGEVFYGGTYFPPDDRLGRPGFQRVLREVAQVWRERPDRAADAARSIRTRVSAYDQAESEAGDVDAAVVDGVAAAFSLAFDARHGGFGRAPKFPNAGALSLLLDQWLDTGADAARDIVITTLHAMGRGGVYDQLGGGFHRYATDERWLVPHFEKMAYDNGPLLEIYARAHAVFGDSLYRSVAEGIVRYHREAAPALIDTGGFPASQDADIGPEDDGDYWTWTRAELRDALGGDDRLERAAVLRYGLDDAGATMPTDREKHVLHVALDARDVELRLEIDEGEAVRMLGEIARRLKAARDERPRPFVDDSVYSSWTALVASGYLAAARHLEDAEAGRAALRALDRVWADAFDAMDGVAHRSGDREAGGYLDDQANVAHALLDAFEWSQQPHYLERARTVVDVMLERYHVRDSGALMDRPRGEEAVGLLNEPNFPIIDSPSPSGNAVAALVLLRLAALVHGAEYRERALEILRAFAGSAAQLPTALATYARAAAWATGTVTTVVVVGEPGDATADALLRTALAVYRPRTAVRRFVPGAVAEAELSPAVAAMLTGEAPRAYVCAGQTCAAPVADPAALADVLRTFRG